MLRLGHDLLPHRTCVLYEFHSAFDMNTSNRLSMKVRGARKRGRKPWSLCPRRTSVRQNASRKNNMRLVSKQPENPESSQYLEAQEACHGIVPKQ
jgi:hypothetical protein